MGMFDWIRFEHPAALDSDRERLFQTKDLTCTGAMYLVTRDRKLIQTEQPRFFDTDDDLLASALDPTAPVTVTAYEYNDPKYRDCPQTTVYTFTVNAEAQVTSFGFQQVDCQPQK